MAKNVELLLRETVENLGLVGDVVRVKPGFARNYLLPHGIAERPTPARVEGLKEARAKAQAELAALRSQREKLVEEMAAVAIELERSCNDQGVLYGSVTQRDIADALMEAGFGVDTRSIRLASPVRHIGHLTVPLQFDKDLRVEITVTVKADRQLEGLTATGEEVEKEEPAEGAEGAAHEPDEGKRGWFGRRKRRDRDDEDD